MIRQYFNPPSPRGEGRQESFVYYNRFYISIHPPLAERDAVISLRSSNIGISIHPPLAERDDGVL